MSRPLPMFMPRPLNTCRHGSPPDQAVRRLSGDTGPLEGLYLFPLPQDLAAHVLDFGADRLNVHITIRT